MSKTFAIGIIGDSHLMRMAVLMSPDFNIYGKGGEMAINWTQYQKAMNDNNFVVILLCGNDITGCLGEPAPSSQQHERNGSYLQSKRFDSHQL